MTGKLNLSIDNNLKEKIKVWAEVRDLTLSLLVENYFRSLLESNNPHELNTPITDSLVGILEGADITDFKAARLENLEGKYLGD